MTHRLLDWKLDLPHDAAVDVPGVGSVGAEDVLADDVLVEAVVLDEADDGVVADVDVDVEGVGAVSISTSSSSSSSFFILRDDGIKLSYFFWQDHHDS